MSRLKLLYVCLKRCTPVHVRRMRRTVLAECIYASSMILQNATGQAGSAVALLTSIEEVTASNLG
jgi:hypothetical protein